MAMPGDRRHAPARHVLARHVLVALAAVAPAAWVADPAGSVAGSVAAVAVGVVRRRRRHAQTAKRFAQPGQ
jgi:hypothetical protein